MLFLLSFFFHSIPALYKASTIYLLIPIIHIFSATNSMFLEAYFPHYQVQYTCVLQSTIQ